MDNDLFEDLRIKQALMEQALGELGKRGRANANAEKEYRIALAKQILIERDKKVPVTIIGDICRGTEDVATLKFMRDNAEVLYHSAKEALNVYKISIRILSEQLDREWNRSK